MYKSLLITTSLVFDRYLNLQTPIDLSFIPTFVWDTLKPGFITAEDALRITKTKFVKKGIKPWRASFIHDAYRNLYLWTVVNITAEYKRIGDYIYKEMDSLK